MVEFPLILGPRGERIVNSFPFESGQKQFLGQVASIAEYTYARRGRGMHRSYPVDCLVEPLTCWFNEIPALLGHADLPKGYQETLSQLKNSAQQQDPLAIWRTLSSFSISYLDEIPEGQRIIQALQTNSDRRPIETIITPAYLPLKAKEMVEEQALVTELLPKAVDGDPDAFSSLYQHFSPEIYRYALRRTSNPSDAEDITADIFIKVFTKIRDYPGLNTTFRYWLFRVAMNAVADHFRSKKESVPLDARLPLDANHYHPGTSPTEISEQMETNSMLRRAIYQLAQQPKQVILLAFRDGLDNADIAKKLGMTELAVRSSKYRALLKLLKIISEAPEGAEAVGRLSDKASGHRRLLYPNKD